VRDVTMDGLWWLPGDPDRKIAGTVSFTGEDRPTLKLIGALTRENETSTGAYDITMPEDYPLIHGLCEQGEVTLVDCQSVAFRLGMPGRSRQSWAARRMLVGILLDQPDEAYFDQIDIGVDHLLAWSGHSGISDDHFFTDKRLTGGSYRWDRKEALVAQLDGEITVQIDLAANLGGKSWADRNERTIKESAGFVVKVPEPQSADALIQEWTKPLQDLLTLATGRACGVHEIRLIRGRPDESTEAGGRPWRPVTVKVYLQPVYRSRPDDQAAVRPKMLFTLQHLSFSEVLPTWLAVNERLAPVPVMLFGLRYIGGSYVENRLITAVAAAEALHRRLLPHETYVEETEYEELRAAALQSVPENHRDWLDNRIWNEPTLKQRLMALVERLGTELVGPFMPKPNRWAKAARDARNSLVHRFPEPPPPGGEGMFVLAEMTSAVITLNLLREIGVPRSQLNAVVTTHEPFRWIAEEGPKLMPSLFPHGT
jgi:hypothetical protein